MGVSRQEILQSIYNKLKFTGAVRSRQDFAEKISYNYTCTSAAFNGMERYLNDRFFTRILKAFPQVSEEYVRTGVGEVLIADPETGEVYGMSGTGIQPLTTPRTRGNDTDVDRALQAIEAQTELMRNQQRQTEKALEQIDRLIEIIQTMTGTAIEKEEA